MPRGRRAVSHLVWRIAGGVGIALGFSGCGHTPATPSGTGDPTGSGIVFLGSDPAPGSTIPVDEVDGNRTHAIVLSFSIQAQPVSDVDSPNLYVELYDVEGHGCAVASVNVPPLLPSRPTPVDVPFLWVGLGTACPYPSRAPTVETTTLKATLRRFGTGEALLTKTFPVRYVFSGPALSGRPTSPEITKAAWTGAVSTGYPEIPHPRQDVEFWCQVRDRDGDALTMTLSLENGAGTCPTASHCWSVTKAFEGRVVDRQVEHRVMMKAPNPAMMGTFTCKVEDARGARATSSTCFTMASRPPCP
jgi:hypothetical protein